MRRRRWRPARSWCWPPGQSGCRPSWFGRNGLTAPPTGAGVLEHDADGSGAAVLAALAKLAKAVAAELVAGGLTIIGITGSSGKTSTKDLVAAVLAPLGEVVAPPGSFNNELGHPWTVLRATRATDYLILEMSARHPGNIAALAEIAPPSIGVVLNVGTAHLGEFGSREIIAQTKSELPQAVPRTGVVILNADDPAVAAMADVTAARVVRVSRHSTGSDQAEVWAGPVSLDELARPQFVLHAGAARSARSDSGSTAITRSATRCARARSRWSAAPSVEQVATALAAAGPVSRHRMHVTTRADGVTVIDDAYNANPDSMRAGLQALAWIAHGGEIAEHPRRSWAVLGEMAELGDDAISEHDRIGRLAVRLDVSRLVVVGTGRSMSAMHHGAVMEGSWGAAGDRVAVQVTDAATPPWLCCAPRCSPGTWSWSRRPTRPAWGRWPTRSSLTVPTRGRRASETDPDRRRHRGGRVHPAHARADPAVHQTRFRPPDPRGRAAESPNQAGHAVDGRCRDSGRHLGRLPGRAPHRAGVRRRRHHRHPVCWCWAWPPCWAASDSSTT